MSKPSETELRIIRHMLVEEYGPASGLLSQVSLLRFDKRHLTGTGYYVHFVPNRGTPVNCQNNEVTEFVQTQLPSPQDTVGFTLFIRDGRLSSFEGYTFGDVSWPVEPMENWLVLNEVAATRRKTE
jgi:hypothetical protein